MVWVWFGVFINGFWTFLVLFEVTLVSNWFKMRLGRRQVIHFSQVGFFGQNPKKSRFQIFVFGPQRGFYRVWMGSGTFLDIKWGVYVVFR